MKKLILILVTAFAATSFAMATPTIVETSSDEATIEAQSSGYRVFIRNHKISIRTSATGTDFTLYMTSDTMPYDCTIWFQMRATLIDGRTIDFNFIPTIYQGQSQSSGIVIPAMYGVSSRQLASLNIVDGTIIQPTSW